MVGLKMTSRSNTKNNAGLVEEQTIGTRLEKGGILPLKIAWEETAANLQYVTGRQFVEKISGDPFAWDILMMICKTTVLEYTNDQIIQEKVNELLRKGWRLPLVSSNVQRRANLDAIFDEAAHSSFLC
jgi:hypothetical protein